MPCAISIEIGEIRGLPVTNRYNSADAYVVCDLGPDLPQRRSKIVYDSLNPVYNEILQPIICKEEYILSNPLVITVMDKDFVSSDDPVGTAVVDLSILLRSDIWRTKQKIELVKHKKVKKSKVATKRVKFAAKIDSSDVFKPKEYQPEKYDRSSPDEYPDSSVAEDIKSTQLIDEVAIDILSEDLDQSNPESESTSEYVIVPLKPKISGWLPLHASLQGIVGFINLTITLEDRAEEDVLSSLRYFPSSSLPSTSTGRVPSSTILSMPLLPPISPNNVLVISSPYPPLHTHIHSLLDFVEELVVVEDPEFLWGDTFRAATNTNAKREHVLTQAIIELRRQVC
ncbi:C2 domain-containing protein 5 like protein, partial [Aduncisulcus paluster]